MATTSGKMRLLRGLLAGERAHTGPFYVTLDVTRRCNVHCLGCRYHSSLIRIPSPGDQSVQDISLEMVERLITELKSTELDLLILSGEGEPFLHPDLFRIVFLAKAAGFRVEVFTNGTLLNEQTVPRLIESRLDVLKVSLWANSREEYERNYPGTKAEYYERVIRGLRLVSEEKQTRGVATPRLVLHQPINRENYKGIERRINLAHQAGCDAVSFSPLRPMWGTLASFALAEDEERSLLDSLDRARKQARSLSMACNIDETLMRYAIGEEVWTRTPCYIGWLHARIKVDGTVLPCNGGCEIILGNLGKADFRQVWNGRGIRSFRRQALSLDGIAAVAEQRDCAFCCHISDNVRVHRVFRWFSRFRREG